MELQDGSFAVNIHLLLNLGSTGQNTALEHGREELGKLFWGCDNAQHEQHFVFLFVLKTLWLQLKQRVRVYGQEGEQKFQRNRTIAIPRCGSSAEFPGPANGLGSFPAALWASTSKRHQCVKTHPLLVPKGQQFLWVQICQHFLGRL